MKDRTSTATGGLILVGVVLLIVGVLSGVGLWYAAGERHDDAVRNLARAPVGCVTTLDFDEAGRYLLFIETRGEIADVVGDCGEPGEFEWTDSGEPSAKVTLIDPEGAPIGLDSAGGVTYDAAGSAGKVVEEFQIDIPGDHLLTVEDGPAGFAYAVGRNPHDGVGALRAGAGLAAAAGVIIGGAMFVLAARRRAEPIGPNQSGGAWMQAPPGRAPAGFGSPPGTGSPPGLGAPGLGAPGWQPVTQPPIRPPVTPAAPIPGQPPLAGGPGRDGPPTVTDAWRRPPFGAGTPEGDGSTGDGSTGDGSTGDGSTGDGEGSPWSPPADRQ